MILPVAVQEVLVAYLKSASAITALVTAVEIRERQWTGDKFVYPNIRVHVNDVTRVRSGCAGFSANAEIDVFSENASSKEANTIAGALATQLDSHRFSRNGISFSLLEIQSVQTALNEGGIWHAKLSLRALMS
jgi:hypothetical protein